MAGYRATYEECRKLARQIDEAHRTGIMDAFVPVKWSTLDEGSRAAVKQLTSVKAFAAIIERASLSESVAQDQDPTSRRR